MQLGGSRSLLNLVAISQRYYQPCTDLNSWLYTHNETMAKIGYSVEDPGTSSQSEGYSSKWLVCREPLILMYALKLILLGRTLVCIHKGEVSLSNDANAVGFMQYLLV